MQLKGLVRFFTIVLIIYSLYQLSFTWFVKNHEKKIEAQALSFVKANYPTAQEKYPNNKDSQSVYQEELNKIYDEQYKTLIAGTKEETVTYGITGAVSYEKAKSEELNLGLDLQGGMNVTLEVEMAGLLKSLSNNPSDPTFQQAIVNADTRKGNSDANFVRLFSEEYKKLNPTGRLATIFASSNNEIATNATDNQVINQLETLAGIAFDNTFRVMRTRIDQFGVAQPNINPDREKGIITVELPGEQDKERVRKQLQSTANLEFWEVYTLDEIAQNIDKADALFYKRMGGEDKKAAADTVKQDTTAVAQQPAAANDTAGTALKTIDGTTNNDTAATAKNEEFDEKEFKKHLYGHIQFSQPYADEKGAQKFPAATGYVAVEDTMKVRGYLDSLKTSFPSDLRWMYGNAERDPKTNKKLKFVPIYAIKTFGREKAKIEGDVVKSARADFDQKGNSEVSMEMNNIGAKQWAKMTEKNLGNPIAIVLDNIVYSAPNVTTVIEGGRSSISGGFSVEEAKDLANLLSAGKLPAPAKIVAEQTVGPTLGAEAIQGGLMSFAISFGVIFALMLIYYNTSGWVANIALVLNILFTVGVLAGLGATLTAPGIAALVLTIGMAVDVNVIIYERIKEEITKGKNYDTAIKDGYTRSLAPVLDSHVTSILTAVILFYFGLGPVKGFATTHILGLSLSLFCGILVSRWVTEILSRKGRQLKYFTSVSKRVFKHAQYKFVQKRKYAYMLSGVILVLGIASFFNGFDYGVEFEGGRSYTVKFDKTITGNIENIREDLKTTFEGDNPLIKTLGDNYTLDITTAYMITSTRPDADSLVERKLYEGLTKYLPTGFSYENFDSNQSSYGKIASKKILPTISDDLKAGAVKASVYAILLIFVYIFLRFRDWRYSIGTILSLLHDVLVTLIVFSFARAIVPFPLEIDQHFIAAILTVIGFSMNDTVIIFDRIREDRKLYPNMPLPEAVNTAINQTLSRTIMTSLTVLLTILILFLVGGEVTRGFAFAMLIGVITGTYSSIFVAAPVLLDLGKKKDAKKLTTEATKDQQ